MLTILNNKYLVLFTLLMVLISCVEPFEIKSESFDDFIVIEAKLTDEIKFQEVKLSRTFKLDYGVPIAEENATVKIIDDEGMVHDFEEAEAGIYISKIEFKAKLNVVYKLSVTTSSGRKYMSKPITMPNGDVLDFKLEAKKRINNSDPEGISIYYESTGTGNENSNYFRYEYIETYKIIAPYWFGEKLVINDDGTFSQVVKDNEDGRICYGSKKSNEVILKNASEFQGNKVETFVIKFNPKGKAEIQHRYSLLVKQHLISREAYVYYETLKNFSESESLFSENQPGLVIGNLFSEDNPNETVIGFFDISKVLSKRVYFNYVDFFERESLIPYFQECVLTAPSINSNDMQELSFAEMLNQGLVVFYAENFGVGGPYQVIPRNCGECSQLGDIGAPYFWEE